MHIGIFVRRVLFFNSIISELLKHQMQIGGKKYLILILIHGLVDWASVDGGKEISYSSQTDNIKRTVIGNTMR